MNCDEALEYISAALDGELSAKERRALDGHLAECACCQDLFYDLSVQSHTLRDLSCKPPEDLTRRILGRLRRRRPPWLRWAALTACMILALMGGGIYLNYTLGGSYAGEQAALSARGLSRSMPACLAVESLGDAGARYLDSQEALSQYLSAFRGDGLDELAAGYGGEFFAGSALLAIPCAGGEPVVESVTPSGTDYEVVLRQGPDASGEAWLVLIETPAADGDPQVRVSVADG